MRDCLRRALRARSSSNPSPSHRAPSSGRAPWISLSSFCAATATAICRTRPGPSGWIGKLASRPCPRAPVSSDHGGLIVAHAAKRHLRGTPRGPIRPARPPEPGRISEAEASDAAHPCLTGLGWSLAQSLRRYAGWACELATGGAMATVTLAMLGQTLGIGGAGADQSGAALLWLGIGTAVVLVIRRSDPLRLARSWGEALAGFRRVMGRHPVACTVAVPVLALGTFDEASIAAPQVAQQLLQLLPGLVAVNIAGFTAAVLLLPAVN